MKSPLLVSFFLIILLCQACKSPTTDKVAKADSVAVAGRSSGAEFDAFVQKFAWASKDSMEVFSGSDLGSPNFPYKGIEMDSLDLRWLPVTLRTNEPYYRCFKIRLDSVHEGLLVRTPSEYESSSIKLFVVNPAGRVVLDEYIELAESFGDAGFSSEKRTWIFSSKPTCTFLIWVHDAEDHSVENENDTTVTTTDNTAFLAWNGHDFDTLGVNKREYLLQFLTLSNKTKSAGQ